MVASVVDRAVCRAFPSSQLHGVLGFSALSDGVSGLSAGARTLLSEDQPLVLHFKRPGLQEDVWTL